MRPLRLRDWAAAALAALALAGCASMSVSSYVERGADFSQYRTYSWAPDDQLSTGDPRLDNNPFFQGRIRDEVEGELARLGYAKATGRPDFVVHYHASVNQAIELPATETEGCDSNDCRPTVYDAGTLMLDVVDARTAKIVWRGWAKDSFDGVVENQDWMEEKIDAAVTRIMERFPRKLS
jgi:hypothetical protein